MKLRRRAALSGVNASGAASRVVARGNAVGTSHAEVARIVRSRKSPRGLSCDRAEQHRMVRLVDAGAKRANLFASIRRDLAVADQAKADPMSPLPSSGEDIAFASA